MENTQIESKLLLGKSSKTHTREAVEEATNMALSQCEKPCFGIVFSTDRYNADEVSKALDQNLNGIPWAGCTSAGVFANGEFLSHGLVLGLISSSEITVAVGASPLDGSNSRQAGAAAVSIAFDQLKKRVALTNIGIIVLADAKFGSVGEIVRGAFQESGPVHIWAGGGVGNVLSDLQQKEFAHGQALSAHVVVIAINSPRPLVAGTGHGWHPCALPAMVTRSHGSTIEELEYKNAFSIYSSTAARQGYRVTPQNFNHFAMSHPLGIPQADGNYIIRDPLKLQNDGSLTFLTEVPDGCLVRMMEGTSSDLLQAAKAVAESVKDLGRGLPVGAFIFDCISRYILLDKHYDKNYKDELKAFKQALGKNFPFIGCLTLGEIGSFGRGIPQFHNKTSVVMALYG